MDEHGYTLEDLADLTAGDGPDHLHAVLPPSEDGTSRWSVDMVMVFFDSQAETYWRMRWSVGATEYQEEDFDPRLQKVKPVSRIVVDFVPDKKAG